MAKYDCSACTDLRQVDPSLIVNGLGEDECLSLQNDTGLSPDNANDDCTDLELLNDCLVGFLTEEVDAESNCNWKPFAKKALGNIWTTLKGIICAICGIWTNIHELWTQLTLVSYVGILTLYANSRKTNSSGTTKKQILAFDRAVRQGNMPAEVINATNDKKGIVVRNTTDSPLLVEATVNVSIRTEQHLASCYLVVARDGVTIGQTPFITPSTYDQQCEAEAFILAPGASTTLTYYFGIGNANSSNWFQNLFWGSSSEDAHLCLEPNVNSDPENQRSYFTVRASSIVSLGTE